MTKNLCSPPPSSKQNPKAVFFSGERPLRIQWARKLSRKKELYWGDLTVAVATVFPLSLDLYLSGRPACCPRHVQQIKCFKDNSDSESLTLSDLTALKYLLIAIPLTTLTCCVVWTQLWGEVLCCHAMLEQGHKGWLPIAKLKPLVERYSCQPMRRLDTSNNLSVGPSFMWRTWNHKDEY